MTDSPLPPIPSNRKPDHEVEKRVEAGENAKHSKVGATNYGAVAVGAFIVGVAGTADIVVLLSGHAVSDAILAASGVLSAAATVVIARFTRTLFEATDDIRKGGEATAQLMAAQQAAMEAMAKAMEATAAATQSSVDVATRGHVAAYPPEFHFVSAQVELGVDGAPPVIVFRIENKGRSPATIVGSWAHDSAFRRSQTGFRRFGQSAVDQEDLIGYVVARNEHIEARHSCAEITNDDIPPLPTLASMFRPIRIGSEPAPPPDILFSFGATIAYTDEGGSQERFSFTANCTPPARHFTEAKPMLPPLGAHRP